MFRFLRSKRGLFILSIAVIVLLIFLHYFQILKPLENGILWSGRGVLHICTNSVERIANFFTLLTSIRDLAQQNEALATQRDRLLLEQVKLREIEEENKTLRAQLKLQQDQGLEGILANVILRNPDNLVQSIMIDQGATEGVAPKAAVIYDAGFLVGRVTEVSSHTAKVLLITDQNSVINALIAESRASGNISGKHGLGLFMDLIPQTEVVNVGDQVITSGLSGDFPKGFLIGEVVSVQSSANQLFQKAQVRPYVNFSKLERVVVIK